jgi:FHS family L-fucose permease-like MFS transporter
MIPPNGPGEGQQELSPRKYLFPFILVTSLFFLWGIANSLNGTLIKHFQTALNLNRAQAGIVDSAFYIGYFVMALPAGYLMNRIGYKRGILAGLFLYALGAMLFYPAANVRAYGFFLFALFVIACGLAFLETAANPYVTVLGAPAGAATRINLSQSFNGLSTIIGPIIGSLFIFSSTEYSNDMLNAMPAAEAEAVRMAEAQAVQLPYLTVAAVVLFIAVLFRLTKMPEIGSPDERTSTMKGIFRHRHLTLGVMAQFFYVGAQASIWGYFVDLKLGLASSEVLTLVRWFYPISDELTPTQVASYHASFALALFMAGRFAGTWLMNFFRPQSILSFYALSCVALLTVSYLTTGLVSLLCLSATYFFMSIMFPTIFALSTKNLGDQMKLGSGLVIMAIVGGAVLPPLTGLASQGAIENALLIPVFSFGVILYYGLSGYKVRPLPA